MAKNKADTVGIATQEPGSAQGVQVQGTNDTGDVLTLQHVRQMSDEEFQDLMNRAQGHSKDFQECFHANFSYTSLCAEARKRGFKNGWYREADVKSEARIYRLRPSGEETRRQSFSISDSVYQRWVSFSEGFPYKSVLIDTALTRLMDDVECGRIDFRMWPK